MQQRLIELSGGARPFREAFAPLLAAAPRERLDAMLARLAVPHPACPTPSPSPSVAILPRPGPSRMAVGLGALAAAVLLFVAGAGTGVAWLSGSAPLQALLSASDHEAEEDWREAVAGYLTLYTPETLASIPDDADLRRRELATVGARLGLALPPEAVVLPGLPLKRAQIFAYDERPLGQVGYLDPSSGPLALCITTGAGAGPALREERRRGSTSCSGTPAVTASCSSAARPSSACGPSRPSWRTACRRERRKAGSFGRPGPWLPP